MLSYFTIEPDAGMPQAEAHKYFHELINGVVSIIGNKNNTKDHCDNDNGICNLMVFLFTW